MSKVILFIATSIDGFIARENGDVAWLEDFQRPEEDYGTASFLSTIGSVVMGSKTYEKHIEFEHWYEGVDGYVFTTRQLPEVAGGAIQFVKGNPALLVQTLKQSGKNIWLEGGAGLLASFMNLQLVDEMVITVVPRLLGPGIPLWNGAIGEVSAWKLLSCRHWDDGVIQSHYERKPNP